MTLFGRRRGSGETIWDIKKHIGYVSSSLHLDYRVSTTVRNVILSGYFDSIGIYQAVSDRQQKLVQQWLDILGIDKRTADAPSIVFPGDSSVWPDRPRTGETSDVAYSR